jgi:hypothetical protein
MVDGFARRYVHAMSFASLGQPAIDPLIDRFGRASDVALVVGAGASMEAGLPSWRSLITTAAARRRGAHGSHDAEQEWIKQTLDQDDLLAGAVVQVMAKEAGRHRCSRFPTWSALTCGLSIAPSR